MKFVVAAAILLVSEGVAATSVQQRSNVFNLLAARQSAPATPSLPNGLGDCGNVCASWEDILDPCYNVTDTTTTVDYNAVLACVCTDKVVDAWASCYDCLIPVVAQEGTDPTFQTDSQTAINEFEQGCDAAGHKVKSPTLSGSSGGSSPSTPSGGAPSPSASGSSGSGGSGGNGASSKGNGASSSGPTLAALALGALGIFAGFL